MTLKRERLNSSSNAIFPATLIMYGAREVELLEAAEHWSGFTTRRPESFGQADGHKTLNSDLGAGLRWQELLPPNREHARLLIRGGVGNCVEIPDWTVFRSYYDATVTALLNGASRGGGNLAARGRVLDRMRKLWADPSPVD